MRIHSTPTPETQGGGKENAVSKPLRLAPGDRLEVTVLFNEGGVVNLKTADGQIVRARLDGAFPFAPGSEATLVAEEQNDGTVSLKAEQPGQAEEAGESGESAETRERPAGRSGTAPPRAESDGRTDALAERLSALKLPVTEKTVLTMRVLLEENPNMPMEKAAFLAANGIAREPAMLSAAEGLFSGEAKLSTLIAGLAELLTGAEAAAESADETGTPTGPKAGTALPEGEMSAAREGSGLGKTFLAEAEGGKTPPPAAESAANGKTPPPAAESAASGKTPPPAAEGTANGKTPPPTAESVTTEKTPPPAESVTNGKTPPPAAESAASGKTPPPAAESAASGKTPPPAAEGPANGKTPPPAAEGAASGKTPPPAAEGTASGKTPPPAAEGTASGKTPPPVAEGTASGKTPPPAAESAASGKTPPPVAESAPERVERISQLLERISLALPSGEESGGEAARKLKGFLENLFTAVEDLRQDGGEKLKQAREEIYTKLSAFQEALLESQVPGKAGMLEQSQKILDQIKLQNQIDQFVYVQIPISLDQEQTLAELYIFRQKKGAKKIDPENVKILLALDLTHAGRLESFVEIREKEVSLRLTVEDEAAGAHFRKNSIRLHGALSGIGYKLVDTKVSVGSDRTSVEGALLALDEHEKSKRAGLDLTI